MMLSSILTPADALPKSFSPYSLNLTNSRGFRSMEPLADPDSKCVWRIVGSGIKSSPLDSRYVKLIVTVLKEAGAAVESSYSGSAANATAYIIGARFRDGGLAGVTGDYWCGPRGVFLWGPLAVRYVAERLRLRISPRHEAILQRYHQTNNQTSKLH